MGATPSILLLYLILVPEFLSSNPSVQEVIWNFYQIKDKRECLTLKENPHFYAKLPTLLEAHGDSVKIDPTEDFRHTYMLYVLTDKQEPVHVIIGDQIVQSFGNLWRSENGVILKGSCVFPPPPLFLTS